MERLECSNPPRSPVYLPRSASEVIAESNIEDPLSDLDVYLTYERFEEAERLVNQAIAADPNQLDYKLKLLEVYHASGNKAAFATSAKELRDATGGQGRLWERATAMWQALSPDQPLLADEPAAASVDVEESEFMDIGVAEQPRSGPGDTVADIGVTEQPRSGPATQPRLQSLRPPSLTLWPISISGSRSGWMRRPPGPASMDRRAQRRPMQR